MLNNVVFLPAGRSRAGKRASPAEQYEFAGDPSSVVGDPMFLAKAAAFQAMRDCLAAADRREIGRGEAEARILVYVRAYLDGGSD